MSIITYKSSAISYQYAWSRYHTTVLTYRGRDKMDAILQTIFSNSFLMTIVFCFKFHWGVPNGRINNMPILVRVMAQRWSGDEPLSKPTMVSFTDAYVRGWALMSLTNSMEFHDQHYGDVIMSTMAQITSLTIVYSIVYLGEDKKNI